MSSYVAVTSMDFYENLTVTRYTAFIILIAIVSCLVLKWMLLVVIVVTIIMGVLSGGILAVLAKVMFTRKDINSLSFPSFSNNQLLLPAQSKANVKYPPGFGRTIDSLLHQIIELITKDIILAWCNGFLSEANNIESKIKSDIWAALLTFKRHCAHVDEVKLITFDIINKITLHFEKIRLAQQVSSDTKEKCGKYVLLSYLKNTHTEHEFVRKMISVLMFTFFPREYTSYKHLHNFLRELLATYAAKPFINTLCDPDYINQKILIVIQYQRKSCLHQGKTFTCASSYGEFVKMIQSSNSLAELKRARYEIMNEVMHLTTEHNMKKLKTLHHHGPNSKVVAFQSAELKHYINKLRFAKMQCEKRMKFLSGSDYSSDWDTRSYDVFYKKMLPLRVILSTPVTQNYVRKFLVHLGAARLMEFYLAVEEMKCAEPHLCHQLGAEIVHTFIHVNIPILKLDKNLKKQIESFLLGEKGPEIFYELQEIVLSQLEAKYYPSFVTSDLYQLMIEKTMEENLNFLDVEEDDGVMITTEVDSPCPANEYVDQGKLKLDAITERLKVKQQALNALKNSSKPDSRLLVLLEKDVENLETEAHQLKVHMDRTEAWTQRLGVWRVHIQAVMQGFMDDCEDPLFELIVHLSDSDLPISSKVAGWVVLKKLSEIQLFHRKLCQIDSSVKCFELPTPSTKMFFNKTWDKTNLERANEKLQNYFDFILQDEGLNKSEILYSFLIPKPDQLKQSLAPKKNKFSFSTFFKSVDSRLNDDEELLLLDVNTNVKDEVDCIAEPLYALLGEIFDLRGVFKWLRRTLITFVQITYDRTINRQLRDTVWWLFSDNMVAFYLTVFKDSWWHEGKLLDSPDFRTEADKLNTRKEAKKELLANIPEVLVNLVGQDNARHGVVKVFETLQDPFLNKQLFYTILESVLQEICPELKK